MGWVPVRNFMFALDPSLTTVKSDERKSEKSKKCHESVYDSVMMRNCIYNGPVLKELGFMYGLF